MQHIIYIKNGETRNPEWRLAKPTDFILDEGQHIAIVGPNAAGKSFLADMLTGRHPLIPFMPQYNFSPSKSLLAADNIKYITFRDSRTCGQNNPWLRWNQTEIDNETPLVGDELEKAFLLTGEDSPQRRLLQKHLYDLFQLKHLLDKYTILMSSGETRKFQLTKALLSQPRVLIIDNPFIGLDYQTRQQLSQLLANLANQKNQTQDQFHSPVQIILIMSKTDELPEFITHVVEVENMEVAPPKTFKEYIDSKKTFAEHVIPEKTKLSILSLPYIYKDYSCKNIIEMNNVSIKYGDRTILSNLNWTVENGQKWAITGQNGAGKTTLLSLVQADNPQAYAQNISLFGFKRGSGESIWDIKKRIGYVSPELHRAYLRDIPTINIVASGLRDTIGLYAKANKEELRQCKFWMDIFQLNGKENVSFLKLSSGEQRLALLARAFVKDPQLLILDEPLHGLDDINRILVRDIIETFAMRLNKTILMVTHYPEELPKCISQTLLLKRHS